MSYHEDTIDWQAIRLIDEWLDRKVSQEYKDQPLAQDWARISKIGEELGKVIDALILATGQNPRKGHTGTYIDVLTELADVVFTAILAMQHLTKDPYSTSVRDILRAKLASIEERITG